MVTPLLEARSRRQVIDWLKSQLTVGSNLPGAVVYKRYGGELFRARFDMLPHLVETFVPSDLVRQHHLARKPRTHGDRFIDPMTLVRQATSCNGKRYKRVSMFEAKRDLALGFLSLWLVTEAERIGTSNRRYWDQRRRTVEDRDHFVAYLQNRGVISSQIELVQPRFFRSSKFPNRCVAIKVNGAGDFITPQGVGAETDTLPRKLYLVQLKTPGKRIPVLLAVRRKGVMPTIAKMVLNGYPGPREVPDRRGMRFGFRNMEELEAGSAFIDGKISTQLGSKVHIDRLDKPLNPHAAQGLVVIKFYAVVDDRAIEVQCLLARQHADIWCSHGPENVLLYHRRQYTDPNGITMRALPPDFHGINWTHGSVQKRMDIHVRARIPD